MRNTVATSIQRQQQLWSMHDYTTLWTHIWTGFSRMSNSFFFKAIGFCLQTAPYDFETMLQWITAQACFGMDVRMGNSNSSCTTIGGRQL